MQKNNNNSTIKQHKKKFSKKIFELEKKFI